MKITIDVKPCECPEECYYTYGDREAAAAWGITVHEAHMIHIHNMELLLIALDKKELDETL